MFGIVAQSRQRGLQEQSLLQTFFDLYNFHSGHGSVVGIATGYGLDGPWIESQRGGEIFRTCPD